MLNLLRDFILLGCGAGLLYSYILFDVLSSLKDNEQFEVAGNEVLIIFATFVGLIIVFIFL